MINIKQGETASSVESLPTRSTDDLTSDPPRLGPANPSNNRRKLFRRADPVLQRRVLADPVDHPRDQLLRLPEQLAVDGPRRDAVDGRAVAAELVGKMARHGLDPGLACAVYGQPAKGLASGNGRDVDDAGFRRQVGLDGLGHKERALEVGGQHRSDVFRRHVGEDGGGRDAGVVYEYVYDKRRRGTPLFQGANDFARASRRRDVSAESEYCGFVRKIADARS
ncbi:hypothetical protein HYQ44_000842 [Verticillium longisporum]|nr:hypothetical protein HYQ44_000842 [Verticillium longisporum]